MARYIINNGKLMIPGGTRAIKKDAFKINEIYIPETVTKIEPGALNGSGIVSITVSERNPIYDSRDNCNAIIETDTGVMVAGCVNSSFNKSIKEIGDYAFYGCNNTELRFVLLDGISKIGKYAFANCNFLYEVNILTSVKEIGDYAFWGCHCLESISIPNSIPKIGKGVFSICNNLRQIVIPPSVKYICCDAFKSCVKLSSVVIPASVEAIGAEEFVDIDTKESVFIDMDNPFANCYGLKKIYVSLDNPNYDSRDNCNAIINTEFNVLIVGCQSTKIPNTVTRIGKSAFKGCIGLSHIVIPDSVKEIESEAFAGCSGLTSIVIPSSVKKIGSKCFSGCYKLEMIFFSKRLPRVLYSDNYSDLFGDCKSLKQIFVPSDQIDSFKRRCDPILYPLIIAY